MKKIVTLLMILCSLFLWGCGKDNTTQSANKDEALKIEMLDIGQGDATLIQTKEQTIMIDTGDIDRIVEADSQFHDALYQASHNQRLVGIISNLRDQFTRLRTRSMNYPGRLDNTLKEHKELVDAIASRDVTRAQELARLHLENAEQTLLAAIKEASMKNS